MKFKLRICLIIIIMLIAIVYLSNSTLSNSISNNSTSSGTIIDKADTDEISPDLYFEAKKDETIKEFIDWLGSSIKGEKEANVEYHVYECKGSTYKDLKEAMKKEELKEKNAIMGVVILLVCVLIAVPIFIILGMQREEFIKKNPKLANIYSED